MVEILIDQIFKDIGETIREPLLVLDSDLKVILANQSFYDSFKVKPKETVGQLIYDLGNKQWDIPKLRELLENILPEKTTFDNYEVEHDFATIGRRTMLLNARQIEQAMGKERIILLAIEDITALKQSEKKLQTSEKKYKSILDSIEDGYYEVDLNGNLTFFNPSLCRMFGYSSSELLGMNNREFTDKENVKKIFHTFNQVFKTGEPSQAIDWEIIKKDGTKCYINTTVSLIKDAKGDAIGFRGIARDVTRHKQAEAGKRISEEKFRSFVEQSSEGIYLLETKEPLPTTLPIDEQIRRIYEGCITECNDSQARMYGFAKAEDLKGVSLAELHGGSDKPENIEFIRSWIGADYRITNVISSEMDKDGNPVWFRNNVIGVVENGFLKRIWGTQIDITEIKQQEENLRQSNVFLDLIVENIPNMIFIKDAKDLCFVRFNRAGEDLLGKSRDDLLGKNDYDLFSKEQADYFTEKDREALRSKEIADIPEEPLQTGHKGERILHTKKVPILGENGEVEYLLGISEDITEIKRAEEERKNLNAKLIQSQKMESIGTLAGGIAHDFNNILSPIIGYAEMILMDTLEDSPDREGLNQIYTSALRAKSLVKQILTFSRQDTSELLMMKMQPIIKEALKLIRATIPTTIEIIQDINPGCGIIKADPTQIHQIVMNLTTNAYHAMEETGGELKVSLKEMEFGTLDLINPNMTPGIYVCLTVADTGKGMDKNLTDKIFDPFFTTKAIGKGTGMGLSVVHGIVTAMGGAINVYSEPGKGTQFHVYLPVEKSLSEIQVIHSTVPIQGGTEQILLVDDEEAILAMEKRMLERLGYQVTSRTSSLEALEAFRANPDKFDLIITDMAMPNMPGDKLSAELIKIRYDIPILLCTGFSETISEEKAISLGIKGFLFKPIVMKNLAQKIREVLI